MKNIFKIITVTAMLVISFSAFAQFNQFQEPRTVVLVYPQIVSATSSNFVTDIHGFEGVAKIDISFLTNNGTSTLAIYTSPDRTNWTALNNFAVATSNSVIYTNLYYGSATPLATNIIMYPGTITTPSASSAGFATKYILPSPFTNTTLATANGLTTIGFVIPDAARYIQFNDTVAAGSNFISAVMTARKQQE